MLPREFLAAPAHPPARLRRVLIAVHVVITLLLRDDGTLVLRAESPDAVDGF
jgi:hypothetical protein